MTPVSDIYWSTNTHLYFWPTAELIIEKGNGSRGGGAFSLHITRLATYINRAVRTLLCSVIYRPIKLLPLNIYSVVRVGN